MSKSDDILRMPALQTIAVESGTVVLSVKPSATSAHVTVSLGGVSVDLTPAEAFNCAIAMRFAAAEAQARELKI